MSKLKIFSTINQQRLEDLQSHEKIASRLSGIGVRFERWQAHQPLSVAATQAEVIECYRASVDALMSEYGFQSVDVIALRPEHPERQALRQKFLDEHTHSDFEVRFFVEGKGLFYIHAGDKVYGVMCEQGDLISVPAATKHWFDMGAEPDFKCIRLFTSPEGWVANYSGDAIAKSYPSFEAFLQS